jgi:hypothetical protein
MNNSIQVLQSGGRMRPVAFFLSILLLLGHAPVFGEDKIDRYRAPRFLPRDEAIQALFDAINSNELGDKKFVVIVSNYAESTEPVYYVAWFHYSCDDKEVVVNYFDFPPIYSEVWIHDHFDKFLHEIILTKAVPDSANAKKLTIPMPKGLHGDLLFDSLHKAKPTIYRGKDGGIIEWCKTGYFISYALGFKSERIEYIRDHNSYLDNPIIENEIWDGLIDPIRLNLFKKEMPEKLWEEFERRLFQNKKMRVWSIEKSMQLKKEREGEE